MVLPVQPTPPLVLIAAWLLMCVVLASLWVRSAYHYDAVGMWLDPTGGSVVAVISDQGMIALAVTKERRGPRQSWFAHAAAPAGRAKRYGATHGFVYERASELLMVGVPYWLLLVVVTFLPTALVWRTRRRFSRRLRGGLCLVCGYDLRGSIDRCPECGIRSPQVPNHST